MDKNHYAQTITTVLKHFSSSKEGLKNSQVPGLTKKYGLNQLSSGEKTSIFNLISSQFVSPLVIILILAATVSLLLGEYKDSLVIYGIIVINAVIGFVQEFQAAKSIDSLKTLIEQVVQVRRDGKIHQIPSKELVPGDVIILQSGDKVPADLRILVARDAHIDESMLTGESVPTIKQTEPLHASRLTLGDQTNMAFAGTLLVRGAIEGVVVATGDFTQIGNISLSLQSVEQDELPIEKRMGTFSKKIGLITAVGSFLVFVFGVLLDYPTTAIFKDMVAVLVASVPEGLPIVVTVTLAIGVQRMARSKAVIRHLPAVETLGSTTVIGTDKTGTLTKNEMTVTKIFSDDSLFEMSGGGYDLEGQLTLNNKKIHEIEVNSNVFWTLSTGVLCNDAKIEVVANEVVPMGDPTEVALLVAGEKVGMSREVLYDDFEIVDTIPFDSTRYYMATLCRKSEESYILVKGSPEVLLAYCDDPDTEKILSQVEKLSSQGLRVLGAIRKSVPDMNSLSENDIRSGFIFSGLVAMIDPPKNEVIQTIKECKRAGIRVVMITGDHATTAASIGEQVGIVGPGATAITGKELSSFTDAQLDELTPKVSIYSRVAPNDKLRIVESLKRHGEIVAVTGDGVNDAPALKSAHIGIAMGKGGTDAAREAADMVILDDNFTSIVKAVEQGRIVFENIRRVALYLVPTGVAAIITVLITMLLGLPIPYTPIQLLWINLIASGLQDIALGFEPGDGESLKKKPIPLKEGIMSGPMLRRTAIVGGVISLGVIGIYTQALRSGLPLSEARSLAMTVTVLFQFFQAWNVRSESKSVFSMNVFSNHFLFFAMIVGVVGQIAVLYIPSLQVVLETHALDLSEWIMVLLVASSVVLFVEIDKAIMRKS